MPNLEDGRTENDRMRDGAESRFHEEATLIESTLIHMEPTLRAKLELTINRKPTTSTVAPFNAHPLHPGA